MKCAVLVLILSTVILSVICTDYLFGEIAGSKLILKKKVKYEALPLQKRVKYFSYNSTRPIKAIKCFDFQRSEASVNVTDGGIGYEYVEMRMKSQKSYRLEYSIEIYA